MVGRATLISSVADARRRRHWPFGGMPRVAVRNVTKRFPGVVANDDVSLDFHAGEIHVLLGENGAGKSTLIGILAGMQQPDDGEIRDRGEPVQIASPRESLELGIGTVFQHVLLVPSLTVIENLMLGGPWWQRLLRAPALARFTELSRAARRRDRSRRAGRPPLAGRAAAGRDHARALARREGADPRRADLDADAAGRARISAQVMRRLRDKGVALILITHKLVEAYELGDRISVLRLGRLVGAARRRAPAHDDRGAGHRRGHPHDVRHRRGT